MVFVNFLRDIHVEHAAGEDAPVLSTAPADGAEPTAVLTYPVDPDQSFRYAEASGDHGTYHVDEGAARSAGLPGVIVHGLCTMAFAARAVVEACCDGDSRRLKRLGVRFTRPLLPDQSVTTRIYRDGESDGRIVYAVEVDDASGDGVIRRGIAEVSG
jgi:acyl dehydratase